MRIRLPDRSSHAFLAAAIALFTAACAPSVDAGAAGQLAETYAEAAPAPTQGTSFAEARRTGRAELTFFYVPSSGFAYRDEAGELTGVTVELLRDFARHVERAYGIEPRVTWVEEPLWAEFYAKVRDSEGGVFGVGNVTITEPRREEMGFSPPYLNNVAVLVTHEDVPELGSMDALGQAFGGLTGLVYPGTLHEARLARLRERHLPSMPTESVASNDELVARLASGPQYFGYLDVYNYHRARQAGQPLRRHAVGDDESEAFGVILPRGSDWAPVIAAFFREAGGYAAGHRFREHLRRHLGDELASLLSTPVTEASTAQESDALAAAFAAEGARGTMLIRRLSDGREWVHDAARADSGFLPASTFKIVNAAIALEVGAVSGVEEHFAWDGVEREIEPWNRDHTLRSGMAVSAVPVYQEVARRIGETRMTEWLRRLDYGNADTGGGIDRFWLTGELRTSARQQVDFLERFVTGATPFSPATVAAVADMVTLDRGPDWALHAKTGWAFEVALGWWVGWTERAGERHVFALNMPIRDSRADPPKRLRIGRAALAAVGALPATGDSR